MFVSRLNCGICLLVLALPLALAGAGWTQTAPPPSPEQAKAYAQAVALLEQAEQQISAKNPSGALVLVKQSNELFTRLQKESAAKLAERELSSQESQQLAINQKLATEAQTQADGLLSTAAAKKKRGQELQAQGQAEPGDVAFRESREEYLQAQTLSIKSAIYALRNQQIIFRYLAP
jgi:hypothetical protein